MLNFSFLFCLQVLSPQGWKKFLLQKTESGTLERRKVSFRLMYPRRHDADNLWKVIYEMIKLMINYPSRVKWAKLSPINFITIAPKVRDVLLSNMKVLKLELNPPPLDHQAITTTITTAVLENRKNDFFMVIAFFHGMTLSTFDHHSSKFYR